MKKITIEAARKNAGFTQREFAKEVGVHSSTLANWEHGKAMPNQDQIRKICEACEIKFNQIDWRI